jgi:hypothetical protein
MILGTDFDNTLVQYDQLFHALARERGLIPGTVAADKTAIRDYLRRAGREADWTELQGIAYGPEIGRAAAYPGAIEALRQLQARGHEVHIISHKSRQPYRGARHDLHQAARSWLERQGLAPPGRPGAASRVCFELTLPGKLGRIRDSQCDWFVEDLPEVLLHPEFPGRTRRILLDPAGRFPQPAGCRRIESWAQLADCL